MDGGHKKRKNRVKKIQLKGAGRRKPKFTDWSVATGDDPENSSTESEPGNDTSTSESEGEVDDVAEETESKSEEKSGDETDLYRAKVLELENRMFNFLSTEGSSEEAYKEFAHADVYLLMATYVWELYAFLAENGNLPRPYVYSFVTSESIRSWLKSSDFRLFDCGKERPTVFTSVLNRCVDLANENRKTDFLEAYRIDVRYDFTCENLPFGLYVKSREQRIQIYGDGDDLKLSEKRDEIDKFKEACCACDASLVY